MRVIDERRTTLLPSEVKAERKRLQGRVRISKTDLTDLAEALIDFQKLTPEQQQWVREEVERMDSE